MNWFDLSRRGLALCGGALLLCFGLASHADEIQDASKLLKEGQHEQAPGRVNAYLSGEPQDAQARFRKGSILAGQGKADDAMRIFTELTEDYPGLPEPYNNLAVLYASQGQYDKARIALETALRTHPSYATAHENLGAIYAQLASQAYDRALQLNRGSTRRQAKLELIEDLFTSPAQGGKPNGAAHDPAASPAQPQPVAEQVPSTPAAGSGKAVLLVVNAWAAAWSSKDVKRYLAFYADDFKTPGGESRKAWEEQRRKRISNPKSIHVSIKNPKVELMDDGHARVSFRQSYHASHLKNSSKKTLVLVESGGGWLIQEEHSGK